MTTQKTAAIVLAAGKGTRMKSNLPKVMHEIAGRAMVAHVVASLEEIGVDKIVVVAGPDMEAINDLVAPHQVVIQHERLGTGHAVKMAREALSDFDGDVLIAYGDTPLIKPETYQALIDARHTPEDPAAIVLGFRPQDPGQYGRLIVTNDGHLDAIIEFKDANPLQRTIDLCNSGVMCVAGAELFGLLDQLNSNNAAGEYYLTDIIAIARNHGRVCAIVEGQELELIGVNSRVQLAEAEAVIQQRLREQAMINGATLLDPASTYFSFDTVLGRDVLVEPHVFFGPGVTVGDFCHIKAFSHVEGASLGNDVVIGPYARLRPGSELADEVKIGNFVETKKAIIKQGAKVNHLTYVGDAIIGERANIGAGTITCNYDGYFKSLTEIGADAFIGSNTSLVAPVKVGDGANIGAGSVITKDVEAGDLGVTRAVQKNLSGWGTKFREKRAAEKAAAKSHK